MAAVYVLIVIFTLTLILVAPVKVTNKTFFALKNLQIFNGTSIAKRLINFSLSVKLEDGKLYINDNRVRFKKRSARNTKKIPIRALLKLLKPDKFNFSLTIGAKNANAAAFAITESVIIMIFDIINNTQEWKNGEIGANLTVLDDRNIAEAQIALSVKINILLIIRAGLLILFQEVRK